MRRTPTPVNLYVTGKWFARSVLLPSRYVPSAKYLMVTMSAVASARKVTGLVATLPVGLTHASVAVPASVRDAGFGAPVSPAPASHAPRASIPASTATHDIRPRRGVRRPAVTRASWSSPAQLRGFIMGPR